MNRTSRQIIFFISRYLVLALLGLFNLYIFYKIFTPLTVYPVYWILKALYGAQFLPPVMISFNGYIVELVSACIAGAAYYLLTILNITTPMQIKKRIKSLSFIIISFLALNITRIIIFSILLNSNFIYFDITHKIVWYFGSIIMVVLIWFINVWIFKISAIPVYTDFRNLITTYKHKNLKSQNRIR